MIFRGIEVIKMFKIAKLPHWKFSKVIVLNELSNDELSVSCLGADRALLHPDYVSHLEQFSGGPNRNLSASTVALRIIWACWMWPIESTCAVPVILQQVNAQLFHLATSNTPAGHNEDFTGTISLELAATAQRNDTKAPTDPMRASRSEQSARHTITDAVRARCQDVPHPHRPRSKPTYSQVPDLGSSLLPDVSPVARARHRAATYPTISDSVEAEVHTGEIRRGRRHPAYRQRGS